MSPTAPLTPQILDALLTYARIGDPTFAGGNGAPAKKLHLNEGVVDVKLGDQEKIAGNLNGKVSRTSTASSPIPVACPRARDPRADPRRSSQRARPSTCSSSRAHRTPTTLLWAPLSSLSRKDCRL